MSQIHQKLSYEVLSYINDYCQPIVKPGEAPDFSITIKTHSYTIKVSKIAFEKLLSSQIPKFCFDLALSSLVRFILELWPSNHVLYLKTNLRNFSDFPS